VVAPRLQAIRFSRFERLVLGREAGLAPAPVPALVPASLVRPLKRWLVAQVGSNRVALRRPPEAWDREVLPVPLGDLGDLVVPPGRWDQMR